jgi:hypothetical protein
MKGRDHARDVTAGVEALSLAIMAVSCGRVGTGPTAAESDAPAQPDAIVEVAMDTGPADDTRPIDSTEPEISGDSGVDAGPGDAGADVDDCGGDPFTDPRQRCDGVCVAVWRDGDNCGACGAQCLSGSGAGGGACVGGTCACPGAPECLFGCRLCTVEGGFACQALQIDPRNCGACGVTCSSATPCCSAGTCVEDAGAGSCL